MTERPLSISTQIAIPIQTAFNSTASISANDAPSATEPVDDNAEEYTIKCICDFPEDDGNTIYCETCNSWQHIECFYPGQAGETSNPDFEHSCADCKPRPLDRRRAHDWQRSHLENKIPSDNGDKKTKRPPSKSHKKKTKPSDLHVNGYHDHDGHRNSSPQDHHPHSKKTKGHRSTQSVSSQIKRSPPFNSRPNSHTHPPSPAHTPPDLPKDFEVHSFSETFQHLYDTDQPFQQTDCNSFAALESLRTLSLWLDDPGKLLQDTGVETEKDAFQRIKADPKDLHWPDLRVDRKEVIKNDMSQRFCSLLTRTSIKDSCAIGELNGSIGFQKDYCNEPSNKWQEFVHPKPFVFFPSHLPLYIDARKEGSDCRYARRSCRPNATVDTMIAHGRDYHFWLVSERQINSGEQVTLPWDFRFPAQCRSRFLHLLNLGDPDGAPFDGADITDEEYEQLHSVTHTVLSEYGGCACELGNDCAFARFHRNYHGKMHNQSNGVKSKKGRKSKQNHVSPTSTGHATNSRAASEGQQDQYDEDDSRSASGSVRSKPHSRDLTPSNGVGETNGILTEPSDREKRKLAMLEDSFRKMEQGQPSRKKKRTSEGSTINGQASSTTPQPTSKPRQRSVAPRAPQAQLSNTNGCRTNKYIDASTSRRESGSPFNARSPTAAGLSPVHSISRSGSMQYRSRHASAAPKGFFADASTQTDEVENAWYNRPSGTPPPKRPIIPLSKRLLKNRLKLQAQIEARRATAEDDQIMLGSPTVSMDLDGPSHEEHPESPIDSRGRNTSIASSTPSIDVIATTVDVNMTDAPVIITGNTIKPPPPPWPGQLNCPSGSNSISGQISPDLRVQMPPTPTFSNLNLSGAGTISGNVTPSSAAGSIVQSPFSTAFPLNSFPLPSMNGVVQSPAKGPKKLSLSDYKAARARKEKDESAAKKPSEASSPTVSPAILKPSLSTIEEAKMSGILEGSAIVDITATETALDPITSGASDIVPKNHPPLEQLSNGTL